MVRRRKNQREKPKAQSNSGQAGAPQKPSELPVRWAWILVGLIIVATGLVRGRLLEFPLERDEGEYAYAGQLILQGIPPYKLAYNMKLPGTYAAYAVMLALFGQSAGGVHLGLMLVNGITILLVFLLGRRLFDSCAGVAAAAAYAMLTVSQGVFGQAAHATHLVALFAVGGVLALIHACVARGLWLYLASGLLLGLAFLMKQHGVFFILFGAIAVICAESQRTPRNWRGSFLRLASFGIGALAPFGATCGILAWAGVLDRFWFWTFTYAREYLDQLPVGYAIGVFPQKMWAVIDGNVWLWLLAAAGLIAVWWDRSRRGSAAWVTGLLVFSFLAVCPGLYFRGHYFIVMLPAVALLAGAAVSWLGDQMARRGFEMSVVRAVPVLVLLAAIGWSLVAQTGFLFELPLEQACRATYSVNPFVEAVEIGRYLREHAGPDDRIAVLGSEPEIPFYSQRRSASGYIYMYGLTEEHPFALTMQREMIAEIEKAAPKYLVLVVSEPSWLFRDKSEGLILEWAKSYSEKEYDLVGVADMESSGTRYLWDAQAAGYKPRSEFFVKVYRRKP